MDMEQSLTNKKVTIKDYHSAQTIAEYCVSTGDYGNARMYYETAAVLGPDESAPYVGLGTVALSNELFEEAELSFKVARRLKPDCPGAYEGLAVVAQKNGNYEQAFEMYLKCLELDTDNLKALLGLFQTSCQMGSFAKVIHYLELYLDSHPGDASVMFTLAALYMKQDGYEKSRDILHHIIELYPDNTDAANLLEEVQRNLAD